MTFDFLLHLLPQTFVVLWVVTLPLPYHVHVNAFQAKQLNQAEGCDFSQGQWVVDESYYPLYDASSDCPFIVQGFDCLINGRPDQDYLKYRWKPSACDLPRFDGVKFLETYRGKKITFVGDSISDNTWQSLACLLHIAVPESKYTLTRLTKHLSMFLFEEYQVTIMWVKDGYLVDAFRDTEKGRILKLDSITSWDMWNGDVLIFNTYHWWFHTGQTPTYFQVGNEIIDMDNMEAYRIGLTTWSNWVDSNIDPSKTTVIFQGIAAAHSGENHCINQTLPEEGSMPTYPGVDIVKSVLSNMKNQVYWLDITLQTQLRIDGHPSIYTGRGTSYEDCSHWCLAGAPDTWNEILYAVLLRN
ncbi:protein trichome birefringence-like 42 [Trifolium pratense]|nr:protein trichome birefringence-like 42 [Trifolium pratense]